jgi:RNA polymerase sigma-70 factor (ECF subfamily)
VGKLEEQRLLNNLRSGRPGACAELIRLHYQKVYRLLVQLTGDVHQAEDLTQETFVSAWEKIAKFQGRATGDCSGGPRDCSIASRSRRPRRPIRWRP